jgi:ATP-dependent Clp endopeptidase proteolytic subunit ClpP
MPFQKFWNLAPDNSNEGVLNMYVYGEIKSATSFFGSEDDVVAGEFIKDLNNYPDTRKINLHINSPGGSVFAAAAIRNQLRKHQATVATWCDGICASAAVGLLLAADPGQRHMSNASLLMIHNPSTRAQGDQQTFIKTADLLSKVKNTILNIYEEGTGLSREQLSAMMDADTYLDSDEALAYNFIDSVTEEEVAYDFSNAGTFVCNGINMDVSAEMDVDNLKDHLQQLANKRKHAEGGNTSMDFEAIMNALPEEQQNILQNAITDKISAAVEEKVTALTAENATAMETLQNTNAELVTANEQLQEQVNALTAPPAEDPIKNLPPEAQLAIAQARADAVAAQKELAKLQEAQAFAEFKETFNEFSNLPIQDTHVKGLQILAKKDEKMYADVRELLKVANTAMGAGFVPAGSDKGTDVSADAYGIIEQRIKEYRAEHPSADYNAAMRAVLSKDPDLYNSYRKGIYDPN